VHDYLKSKDQWKREQIEKVGSPSWDNSRAVVVEKGEKTTVANRMHMIRKAFILEILLCV
jgi:hypothetical protein